MCSVNHVHKTLSKNVMNWERTTFVSGVNWTLNLVSVQWSSLHKICCIYPKNSHGAVIMMTQYHVTDTCASMPSRKLTTWTWNICFKPMVKTFLIAYPGYYEDLTRHLKLNFIMKACSNLVLLKFFWVNFDLFLWLELLFL